MFGGLFRPNDAPRRRIKRTRASPVRSYSSFHSLLFGTMTIARKLLGVVFAAALATAQTPSYRGELLIEPLVNNGKDEGLVFVFSTDVDVVGMCLTAASNNDGAIVTIESCTGATSQKWTFTGGSVQVYGNKCLDVTNGSTANGVKLQIWTCSTNGNPNQQFYYTVSQVVL